MVKKKEKINSKLEGLPIIGICTFSKECESKTEKNECTWTFGCVYRE